MYYGSKRFDITISLRTDSGGEFPVIWARRTRECNFVEPCVHTLPYPYPLKSLPCSRFNVQYLNINLQTLGRCGTTEFNATLWKHSGPPRKRYHGWMDGKAPTDLRRRGYEMKEVVMKCANGVSSSNGFLANFRLNGPVAYCGNSLIFVSGCCGSDVGVGWGREFQIIKNSPSDICF